MNVDKRIDILNQITLRAENHSAKARKIADELNASATFKSGAEKKFASKVAKDAVAISKALDRVTRVI